MKDIRIDADGAQRCWKCGGRNFTQKRTVRAKVIAVSTVAVGALATKKKLQCQACGAYNDVGSAKSWDERRDSPHANNGQRGASSDFDLHPGSIKRALASPTALQSWGSRSDWDGERLVIAYDGWRVAEGMPPAVSIPVTAMSAVTWSQNERGVGTLEVVCRSGQRVDLRFMAAQAKTGESLRAALDEAIAMTPAPDDADQAGSASAQPAANDLVAQIERLDSLRRAGAITEEEFAALKAKLLA